MSVHQGVERIQSPITTHAPRVTVGRVLRRATWALTLVVALAALGAAVPSAQQQRAAALVMTTAGWTFDITGWMAAALWDKAQTAVTRPAAGIDAAAGADMVRAYLDRAAAIREAEADIEALFAAGDGETAAAQTMQARLDALRTEQDAVRSTVEQIIERQVGGELARRGLGFAGASFPPVQFTFVEPPKKLVVSPRDRIATVHYRMLQPAFSTADAEATEATITADFDLSAYVTRIGGLGAYPSMVIDRGDIPWIMSTVAHEWTHNYLTLFPLGLSYNRSPQLTTINETVAEIVGNEVGAAVVARYYPEFAPEAEEDAASAADVDALPGVDLPPSGPTPFDFRTEMRRTRLMVDRLLADGRVEDAERYMEQQRQQFVANGYPIRKLNQAYFAFHGSYGTSAASTDPLVPLLFQLRDQSADTRAFLRNVRGVTSSEQLAGLLKKSDF